MYPTHKIDPTVSYYALTFTADSDGKVSLSAQTQWVGWADDGHKIEMRQARIVDPNRIAELWMSFEMPFCVVNDVDDFVRWYHSGGHALVTKSLGERVLPDCIKPSPSVQKGALGFTSIRDLPDSIFDRAPTPKQRMKILKRDDYRCRICGRRSRDHVDIELHVHHIRPFGKGGVTHEENLITLCHTCHRGLDPHYEWSLFELLDSELESDMKSRHQAEYMEEVRLYRQALHESRQTDGAS